jgi:iron complex outermembrane receptor protein
MFMLSVVLWINAQERDSMKVVRLGDVSVSASYEKRMIRNTALPVDVVGEPFLRERFTGNLIQTLEHIPGVHSMNIGAGFSKPVIRGMGFNRISVIENGIKQEGQQWGIDHGLEIDAFNTERVTVRKGPASLLYGSDAMGGTIEITQRFPEPGNYLFGEAALLGKSINGTVGGSALIGIKKEAWYARFRYSEQRFGDYRIPADTIVYLTQRLPVYGRKLKNTAGLERDMSLYTEYRKGRYSSNYAVSNAYQKVGFFPGTHGIPDMTRLQDDGSHRNIELPFSTVNHLKATTHQQYMRSAATGYLDAGYQRNDREELSRFHTHYDNQAIPEKEPDRELAFSLETYSLSAKIKHIPSTVWEHTAGWDVQHQRNRISGYSFLLPEYRRFTTGLFWLGSWYPAGKDFSVSGGARYDYGKMDVSPYRDGYLESYLADRGYGGEVIERYAWRSVPVNRRFGDFSGSLGLSWHPGNREIHLVKVNIGHSFRLPGAYELTANGVHHGAFRHEQGDPSLSSEQGWQLDLSYTYREKGVSFSASPYAAWFGNYIFLRPTGEWSVLPHAGQIYRYTGAEALFAGAEITFGIDFRPDLNYTLTGEYVYTLNLDEHIPLSFSPPASMRNTLTWTGKNIRAYAEWQSVASQNRVARNEDPTRGAHLLHAGATVDIRIGKAMAEIALLFQNILDTRYYNHLSFYRKVEIPEPGRNVQLLIKVPFKSNIK